MVNSTKLTALPRSQEEIYERAIEAQERDPFGFESHEYIGAMTIETVRPLVRDGADMSDWPDPDTVETLDKRAKEYLPFWLVKIEGERGISVVRATQHFTAWKWLLGHPDADTFPGSLSGRDGGWYQRDAYEYILGQVESGAWDRMTAAALEQAAPAASAES